MSETLGGRLTVAYEAFAFQIAAGAFFSELTGGAMLETLLGYEIRYGGGFMTQRKPTDGLLVLGS